MKRAAAVSMGTQTFRAQGSCLGWCSKGHLCSRKSFLPVTFPLTDGEMRNRLGVERIGGGEELSVADLSLQAERTVKTKV